MRQRQEAIDKELKNNSFVRPEEAAAAAQADLVEPEKVAEEQVEPQVQANMTEEVKVDEKPKGSE